MAAPTQTAAQKAGISLNNVETSEGVFFQRWGALYLGQGAGSPNGEVTAPAGSMFVDITNTNLYMNTDSSTTWELVGAQS